MTGFHNEYEALGLPDFADAEAVKAAFRRLARQHHPDLNGGDAKAEEKFKTINAAYDVLSDPVKRAVHDRRLKLKGSKDTTDKVSPKASPDKPTGAQSTSKTTSTSPTGETARSQAKQASQQPKRKAPQSGHSFGELFDDWLKKGFSPSNSPSEAGNAPKSGRFRAASQAQSEKQASQQQPQAQKQSPPPPSDKDKPNAGENILGKVWSGVTGGEGAGKGERPQRGDDVNVKTTISPAEASEGTIKTVHVQHHEVCRRCSATGKVNGAPCTACHGEKSHTRTRKLEVRIPPAVKAGSRVRVAKEGGRGNFGGEPGDLFLQIEIVDESAFRMEGLDVHGEMAISLTDAVLGASVDVMTLAGPVTMTIPAGTQPGRVFRLKEQGEKNGAASGDHFVTITIAVPEQLTTRERELYQELARLRPKMK